MIGRRAMLGGLAAAGAMAAGPVLGQAGAGRPLHVQFFTFNAFCGKGWDKFSEGMAIAKAIGYDGIEFAGVWGHDPKQIKRRADELGLALRSYHLGNDIVRAFQAPGPGGIADAQDATYTPIGVVQVCRATLGIARDLGCEWGGLGASGRSNFTSLDNIRRLAEAFDKCGELAQAAGIKFFYHNHAIDFKPVEGRIPFDVLAENTGAGVRFQFDTGWAASEGFDPVPLIQKHAARIDLVHLRDATAQRGTAAPGDGVIDFAKVMAASAALRSPLFIMEGNGRPETEAVAEATRAYQVLNRLGLGRRTA
jgi:sugar phosphate isomerase/epimerase